MVGNVRPKLIRGRQFAAGSMGCGLDAAASKVRKAIDEIVRSLEEKYGHRRRPYQVRVAGFKPHQWLTSQFQLGPKLGNEFLNPRTDSDHSGTRVNCLPGLEVNFNVATHRQHPLDSCAQRNGRTELLADFTNN